MIDGEGRKRVVVVIVVVIVILVVIVVIDLVFVCGAEIGGDWWRLMEIDCSKRLATGYWLLVNCKSLIVNRKSTFFLIAHYWILDT